MGREISAAYDYSQQRRWWQDATASISVTNVAADKKQKKAKPTAADKAAAAVIKKKLDAMGDKRPTQYALVAEWTKTGSRGSQSSISQYISGGIPHNLRSVTFFARILNCDPREIYPGLPGLENYSSTPRRDEVRDVPPLIDNPFLPAELAILRKLLDLPPDMQEAITDVIANADSMNKQIERRTRRTKKEQRIPEK
jgi:hypothetical protein